MPEKIRENHNTKEYWDAIYAKEIAKQFGRPDEGRWNYILAHILRHDTVLDFGCGWGEFLLWAIPKRPYAKFVGVDYSKVAIDKARELLPNTEFFELSSLDSFVTYKIDVITVQHTLEHLEQDEKDKVMENAWLALNPGGRLIIVLPLYDDWIEHPEIWKLEDIREFVKQYEDKFESMVIYRPTTCWSKPDFISEETIIIMKKKGVIQNVPSKKG